MRKTMGAALACGLLLSLWGVASAQKAEAPKSPEKPKAEAKPRKEKEPFYRPFLIPGNPLDDRILEQEKLIHASPKSAALRNDFGNLLALRRFPKEAREQYEIAMKLDKRNYLAPYNLGIVFETEGKISQAIRAYEKSVDRNRGFPPSLFRLARLLEKTGWDRRAVETYAKALRIDPEMRDPAHNPLVVDTLLLDRVSLTNYARDLATASLASDARYADEARFRHIAYDRAIDSSEVGEAPTRPATPAAPTPSQAAKSPAPASLPAAPGQTRPQSLAPAPPSAIELPTPVPSSRSIAAPVPRGAPLYAPTAAPPGITPIPPPPTPER